METFTMKIEYRKLTDNENAPWLVLTNINEVIWSGAYLVRVINDNGSSGLPFRLNNDDTVTLVVKDHSHEGLLQQGRTTVQTFTRVERSTGKVLTYIRTCCKVEGQPQWSEWSLATDSQGNSIVDGDIQEMVTWDNTSHIDNYIIQGTYKINGVRTNTSDGLPIYNTGKIEARLTVLSNDECVTQILTLLNVGGGDSNIYVRTKQGNKWETWGKLQSNIEVGSIGLGQMKSFNDLTDNGIYSGVNVYASGTDANGYPLTSYETFVLVVINAYLTGGGVSQLKYGLLLDGTTTITTRTKHDNVWSEWHDISTVDKEVNVDSEKPVQNKAVAQAIAQAITNATEQGCKLAKRDLFIAAGALYNDTGADITKTAPWGETVIHKVGHYYLNGLGDITEEQMTLIYNAGTYKGTINYYAGYNNIRTFLPAKISGQEGYGAFQIKGSFADCKNIEVVRFSSERNLTEQYGISIDSPDISNAFYNCNNLKYIQEISLKANSIVTNTFGGCRELVWIKLFNLAVNLSFSSSLKIGKGSILFIIQKAKPTSAITITLHPEAYARLANDADIVAALEAQPLVSLVSA